MVARSWLAAMAAVLLSGCAIHPVPEDVAHVSTVEIAHQIRCEAKATIRQRVIQWLASLDDAYARNLAARYDQDEDAIRNFSPALFGASRFVTVQRIVKLFYTAAVAYDFDLDMAEDNNLSAGFDLLKPFTNGTVSLGVTSAYNRKRGSERTFAITDTFGGLLKIPAAYCTGFIAIENYNYPITGKIGVHKVVNDFIEMTLLENLGDKDKPKGPPTMTDQLTFTTSLSIAGTPKVTFTPPGTSLQLTDATLTGLADRIDTHKVTIGLAIDAASVANVDPVRQALFSPIRGTLVVGRQTIGGGTGAEQLAIQAVDIVKSREIQINLGP